MEYVFIHKYKSFGPKNKIFSRQVFKKSIFLCFFGSFSLGPGARGGGRDFVAHDDVKRSFRANISTSMHIFWYFYNTYLHFESFLVVKST